MKTKTCPAYVKAPPAEMEATDPAAGVFEAIVSVFNNRDHGGDTVRPGAFVDTIAAWKASPDVLPVLWNHRMDDPRFNIGAVVDIDEIPGGDERIPAHASAHVHAHGGLWVRAQLDTGADASDVARHARRLLVARRVTQFSYAYDDLHTEPTDDGVDLLKLWIYEVSPTQVGMNELTELGEAKRSEPPAAKRTDAHLYRLRCDIAALEVVSG